MPDRAFCHRRELCQKTKRKQVKITENMKFMYTSFQSKYVMCGVFQSLASTLLSFAIKHIVSYFK